MAKPTRQRPRSRKEPIEDPDNYAWNSEKIYICAECDAKSKWVRPWRWYGSYLALEAGQPVVTLCSDACQESYEEKHGTLTENDPLVEKVTLQPAAFEVVCPGCETHLEVLNWNEEHPGYFEFDCSTIDGPLVHCTQCGTFIDPQPVKMVGSNA